MIPDYSASLIEAEARLRKCYTTIIDDRDLVAALEHAVAAALAVELLQIDLVRRLCERH